MTQKKLSKSDRAYIDSMNAWLSTAKLIEKSCEIRIKQCKENIELNRDIIKAEQKELRMKKKQTVDGLATLKAFIKNRSAGK